MSGFEINLNTPIMNTSKTEPKTNDLSKKFELGRPTFLGSREQNIGKMAHAWKLAYPKANEADLRRFIKKLYSVCKELNITTTNNGKHDTTRYKTKEDQIVDEMMAIFANESKLNPNETLKTKNETYRGLIQLGNTTYAEMKERNPAVRPLGTTLTEQLDNMVDYFKHYKTMLNIPDLKLNPKRVGAMIKYPKAWKYDVTVGGKKSQQWWEIKNKVIQLKIFDRDHIYAEDQRQQYRKALKK